MRFLTLSKFNFFHFRQAYDIENTYPKDRHNVWLG